MHPLPLVSLIIGLFVLSALALAGLIASDRLAERRRNPPQRDQLQLSFESLIEELTSTA
jgi:hypothetical protein